MQNQSSGRSYSQQWKYQLSLEPQFVCHSPSNASRTAKQNTTFAITEARYFTTTTHSGSFIVLYFGSRQSQDNGNRTQDQLFGYRRRCVKASMVVPKMYILRSYSNKRKYDFFPTQVWRQAGKC